MAVDEFLLGRREAISFSDAEGTYGTAGTLIERLGRNAQIDPSKNSQNWTEIRGAATNSLNPGSFELGQEDFGGTLTFIPQNWKFLKFVLLSAVSDVTDTDNTTYYTHTFTNGNSGLLPFTLERGIQTSGTDRVRTYEGCQVNSFSLAWDASGQGNFVTAAAEFFAEDANNGTSVTSLTAPSTEGFKPRHVGLTLESTLVSNLKSGTFTVNNNLSDGRYANFNLARLKGESVQLKRNFVLTAVVDTKDDTYWDAFDGGVVLTGTNKLVFDRGTNDELTITFGNAYLNTASDPTNLDGINQTTLNIVMDDATFVVNDALSDYSAFT